MDPALLQANSAVAWTAQQVTTKQPFQIVQNSFVAGRMQPVAAIIRPHPIEEKAARVPPHSFPLFQNDSARQRLRGESKRGAETGRACSQDGHQGLHDFVLSAPAT